MDGCRLVGGPNIILGRFELPLLLLLLLDRDMIMDNDGWCPWFCILLNGGMDRDGGMVHETARMWRVEGSERGSWNERRDPQSSCVRFHTLCFC